MSSITGCFSNCFRIFLLLINFILKLYVRSTC